MSGSGDWSSDVCSSDLICSDEAVSFSGEGAIQGNIAAIIIGSVPCAAALSADNIMFGACDIPGHPNGGSCAIEYRKR